MAVHQNLAEIGWFYHAPEPPRKAVSHEAPLASQIPGLNDLSSIPHDDAPRPLFRDTDTNYIRTAKMGGREDLLRHREPKKKAKEPVAYPRNDWYYLEDNKMEENCSDPKMPWEFRLPEYMVHDEHKPFGDGYDYRNDPEGLIYWKKGRVPPGAPEIKHVSRGQTVSQPLTAPPPVPQAKPASGRNQHTDATRYPEVPAMYDKSGRPAMNKLLAYGYASEGNAARDEWYRQVRELEDEEKQAMHVQAAKQKSAKSHKSMTWNDMKGRQIQPANASRRVSANATEKPLFKISKFENVGAKVNSHNVLPPIQQ